MQAPVYDFTEPSRLELVGDAWVDYDPHFQPKKLPPNS